MINTKFCYHSLNTLKGFACIGVILMHCCFPGAIGKVLFYLFKFAVPTFFFISGFFLYHPMRDVVEEKSKKQIIKIAKLLLATILLYTFSDLCYSYIHCHDFSITNWIKENFGLELLPKKIIFGYFFNGPSWFLHALLFAYITIFFINKHNSGVSLLSKIAPFLIIIHITGWTILKKINSPWSIDYLFANFLLYALPCLMIGFLISKYKEQLCQKMTDRFLWSIAIFGCLLQFLEYYLFKQSLYIYYGSILYSVALFILSLKHPTVRINPAINYIGQHLSMPVYVLHFGVIFYVFPSTETFSLYSWLKPIIVILFSLIVSDIWFRIHKIKSTTAKNS